MFSRAFILFIERYIAAPAVALLITNGLVDQKHSDIYTQILGEVCGWGFIFLVYIFTHNRQANQESQKISGGKFSLKALWNKIAGYVLTNKADVIVTEVADPQTP